MSYIDAGSDYLVLLSFCTFLIITWQRIMNVNLIGVIIEKAVMRFRVPYRSATDF